MYFYVYCVENGVFIANVCARISRIVTEEPPHMVFAYVMNVMISVGLILFCILYTVHLIYSEKQRICAQLAICFLAPSIPNSIKYHKMFI